MKTFNRFARLCLAAAFATAGAGFLSPATPMAFSAPAAQAAQSTVDVHIADAASALGGAAAEGLREQTEKIDFPDSVREVVYLLIPGSSDNFNDDALSWAESAMPSLVPNGTGPGATWANGALILGVGTETRTNGVYCGNDVCQDLDIFEGPHLDASLEAMKDGFQRGNFAQGLVEGAKTAADTELGQRLAEKQAKEERAVNIGLGATGVAAVAGGTWWWQRRKKDITATAKGQFHELSTKYVEVSGRLDELDIRAHSLSSPLANAELRGQWESIRDEFLALNRTIDRLGLNVDSEDKAFYEKHTEIAQAHRTLESMGNAEENINLMFSLENGDATLRRRELDAIQKDISEALFKVENSEAVRQLRLLDEKVAALLEDLEAPDFMDRLATIINDQAHAMDLASRDMEHLDRSAHEDDRPSLRDRDWRPGYVYSDWVPWFMLATWNNVDTRAAEQASSSGSANTTFSSGFSGGGGSSSW